MKLFTVGPVEMYESTLELRSHQLPYFRTEEFSQMMLGADRQLRRLLDAEKASKTVYLTASGTGAMEATVMNCFGKKDKLLIINGGTFGARFEKICQVHGIDYTSVMVPIEKDLTEEMLKPYEKLGYTGLLVNIHETSIGKLYDIEVLSNFCKKNEMFLVVDAISSTFVDYVSIKQNNTDAFIFSSQKAMSLSPGMSGVILSEKMVDERVMKNQVSSMYFDFKEYIDNFERGQTPYTPCVGVFIEFANMMQVITDRGINSIIEERNKLANFFRGELIKEGFCVPQYKLSNGLTPVYIEDAYNFYYELKEKYDLVVTPNGGGLKERLVRVGHMGNLKIEDYEYLIQCMLKIGRKN